MFRFLIFVALFHSTAIAEFRAAAVKIDITPSDVQPLLGYGARKSTGVHDPLFHRIAALDDGKLQFFLVSTDIALISPSFFDGFAAELERETGISPRQVWWTSTHSHSAPEVGPPGLPKVFMPERYRHQPDMQYANSVQRSLIDGIKEARARLAPARLAVGEGFAMANINRRARDVDGRIRLGLNPYGPVDRQIGVIRLERVDGTPIAAVANYAIHGTALGGANTLISGDVPGLVAGYVEEKIRAPLLFVNGAAGDVAPIYSGYPDFHSAHITEFNVLLGDRILEALTRLPQAQGKITLRLAETIVETPRKQGLHWAEDLAAYTRTGADGTNLVRLPIRFLGINADTVIWAAPLEMFCEIAMRVREQAPFRHTFFFGYTNGWLGYLPTKRAFGEGGYEPNTSPFTERAEEDLIEAVIALLHGWSR
ncbi:MAG: neutral/alkaline non-lysosomal ceramidase N-terminal domain-containing protein [Bryobacteraceae bacterium]|nr:neutral/alkaline non-lysosomal ceramidase N-terminal domain-containing protein [Bryobacterales bacterium]NUN03132.1 neutral/alkaline non-lysosomal ceramidase N-terminal domain-containing protein [Bryobacteraceae bacterium]